MERLAWWGGMVLVVMVSLAAIVEGADPELTAEERQRVSRLINDLDSEDPATLHAALLGLANFGPKAANAVKRLGKLLDDERKLEYASSRNRSGRQRFQVNLAAIEALRNIGPSACPAFATAIQGKREYLRVAALRALSHRIFSDKPVPLPIEFFNDLLKDANPEMRQLAAWILATLKDAASVEPLCRALKDDDFVVRIGATLALGQIGDPKAIGPLIDAYPGEPAKNRIALDYEAGLANALAQLGDPAVTALLERYDSLDGHRRGLVPMAIRYVDPKRSKSLLLECLKDPRGPVREGALNALANLKTAESHGIVIEAAADSDPEVRKSAARLLRYRGDEASAQASWPVLLKLAGDSNMDVRHHALATLALIPIDPDEEYHAMVAAALQDESSRVRYPAASLCAKHPDPRYGPRLIELLADADVSVRTEAAAALGNGGFREAVPQLVRLLDDGNDRCAAYAATSLGILGTDAAIDALAAKMSDPNLPQARRVGMLDGLCMTNNPKAIAPLSAALNDPTLGNSHERAKQTLEKLRKP